MTISPDNERKVPDKSPYEVSTAAPKDRTQQPTAFQIFGAIILAIVAGVLAFFTTCFGTGVVLLELADTYLDSEPFALLILAFVVGVLAAALAIHKTYRLVIRSRVSKMGGGRTGDNNG